MKAEFAHVHFMAFKCGVSRVHGHAAVGINRRDLSRPYAKVTMRGVGTLSLSGDHSDHRVATSWLFERPWQVA